MAKKDVLAQLLVRLRGTRVAIGLGFSQTDKLIILAYHRVLDLADESSFPYDPELVSASVEDFTWQMAMVRRYFRPLHLSEALRWLDEGRPLPPRAIAVTFDDGHGDNYTNAFPVLRRLGIPAMIFLSTGYIDRGKLFWFDEVALRLSRTPQLELEIPTLDLRLRLENIAQRRRATALVLACLKAVPDQERHAALKELACASELGEVAAEQQSVALTWHQIAEMHDAGIEFGSHTVSHPVLSRVSDPELYAELSQSRQELEGRLGQPVEILSYPVGGRDAVDDRVICAARDCGYRLGLSYLPGVNRWPLADRYRLHRLAVERYTTRARFEAMLAFPTVFQ